MIHQADYVVPVEIENQYHNVYVIKRPGVDGTLDCILISCTGADPLYIRFLEGNGRDL